MKNAKGYEEDCFVTDVPRNDSEERICHCERSETIYYRYKINLLKGVVRGRYLFNI